jgi:hypothetical protein
VTPSRVLAELESIAVRLGIAVRVEPFGSALLRGRGGLCRVRGEPLIVMDAALPILDRIALMADALARFDLDDVHVVPAVRERIDAARAGARTPSRKRLGRVKRAPASGGRPGLARTRPKH